MKWLWGIAAGIIGGFILSIVYRRNPWRQIKREFAAIEAARAAKQMLVEQGAGMTRRSIEAEHVDAIRVFDVEQKAILKNMRGDPVKLARWLTRIAQG